MLRNACHRATDTFIEVDSGVVNGDWLRAPRSDSLIKHANVLELTLIDSKDGAYAHVLGLVGCRRVDERPMFQAVLPFLFSPVH